MSHLKRLLEKDPMLRDILAGVLPSMPKSTGVHPDVDVYRQGSEYTLVAELPGVSKDDLKLRLEGARLVLSGTKHVRHPESASVVNRERVHGTFSRQFLLPNDAEPEGIKAHFEDGLLTVTVPCQASGGRDVPIDD